MGPDPAVVFLSPTSKKAEPFRHPHRRSQLRLVDVSWHPRPSRLGLPCQLRDPESNFAAFFVENPLHHFGEDVPISGINNYPRLFVTRYLFYYSLIGRAGKQKFTGGIFGVALQISASHQVTRSRGSGLDDEAVRMHQCSDDLPLLPPVVGIELSMVSRCQVAV